MPEAYELHDGRFLQMGGITSGAGDVSLADYAVPADKIWTILQAGYGPSAAETKIVQWFIRRGGVNYPITQPVSVALTTTTKYAAVTEGMEIKLYPGEQLYVVRDSATAGSTMTLIRRFIETDLPYYSYVEPLNKVVRSAQRHGSTFRATGGISPGGSGSGGGTRPPGGREGGGGGAQPI